MPQPEPAIADAIRVEISDTQRHLAVDPDWVARVVRATLASEGVARAVITVALTDDASIRDINRRHLSHDWATDVISFPLSEPADDELVGDLVISAEMAVNSATEFGSTPGRELALYLVHGLLHFCGYDDHADDDVVIIRARETAVLASLGLDGTTLGADPGPASTDHSGREGVRWPR